MKNNYYELDKNLIEKIKEIEKITYTDYGIEDNKINIESLISIIEDLLCSYNYLEEQKEDIENDMKDNYRPITVNEMGINSIL